MVIILIGAGLRFYGQAQDFRFHSDEAYYTRFARDAAVNGYWMLTGPLDKPPLSIYAIALSMHLTAAHTTNQHIIEVDIRQGEFAARLPNTLASIILIALVYELTAALYNRKAALIAAMLTSTSPFLLVFSASAFIDMFMVTFMTSALVSAFRQRPGWSGVFLALSFASKQQGIFYFPLIAAVLYFQYPANRTKNTLYLMLTLLSGIALLMLWDAARPEDSLFVLASVHSNPERIFIRPEEVLPRLETWITHAQWILSSGPLTGLLISLTGGILIYRSYQHRLKTLEVVVLVYLFLFFVLHWLLPFNTFDRYLMPMAPLIILLVAGNLNNLITWTRPHLLAVFISAMIFALLTRNAVKTAQGEFNIGRDGSPRQNDMIILADFFNQQPLGTIIYDHWLGYELDYYLGAWTDKRRVYYPEPQVMAEDALKNPESVPRYFVAPSDVALTPWLYAYKIRDFRLSAIKVSPQYQIYRVTPLWVDAASG